MDMIERVARAMAFDQGVMWDGDSGEWPGPDEFRAMARAAIPAMLEPTDEMIAAVEKAQDDGGYVMYEHIEWQDAWPIAIRAALEQN